MSKGRAGLSRRRLLAGAAALAAAPKAALSAGKIRLGSLLDLTGRYEAYGSAMDKAARLAVKEINSKGGLLGSDVELVTLDTQSDLSYYVSHLQNFVRGPTRADAVVGAYLPSTREAIRTTLRKNKVPYFYSVPYEGGVCDRNMYATGLTPFQQTDVLLQYGMQRWGKNVYVVASDNLYGKNISGWANFYAINHRGTAIQTDYFPLDAEDFGAAVLRIRDAKPDFVLSVLSGTSQLPFHRQWASAGMKESIPVASTALGACAEHTELTAEEGEGIVVCHNYAKAKVSPVNLAFKAAWTTSYGSSADISEIAVSHYQGIKLWAKGVEEAGSTETEPLAEALEQGIGITGPAGKISVDPNTHHVIADALVQRLEGGEFRVVKTHSQIEPEDTQSVCDLGENPDDNDQYLISF